MNKHSNEPKACPECEEKLLQAHTTLAEWFRSCVKPAHQDCHISWSYRDQKSQNEAYAEGKSKLAWPMSAHNKSDDQGNPCSMALDLFQIASNGMAVWGWKYFKQIADEAVKNSEPIEWGGSWQSFEDSDHYELK